MNRTEFTYILLFTLGLIVVSCSTDNVEIGQDISADVDLGEDGDASEDEETEQWMTFEVTLPDNTPPDDVITMYTFFGVHDTERVSDGVAQVTLQVDDFTPDGPLHYRFTRNGADFIGAEYLEPDTNDFFYTELGRQATFENGATQQVTIQRWRWFPEGDVIPAAVDIEEPIAFVPRIDGVTFAYGVYLQDLYLAWFDRLFEPCAQHLADLEYEIALISPAWHVNSLDPPEFGRDDNSPDYTDEALRAQIEALADAGLQVIVQPQIDPMMDLGTGRDSLFWDAFFAELARFLEHHARIAQSAGAQWFSFYPYGQHQQSPPPDMDQRWRQLITGVRGVFDGAVGVQFVDFSTSDGTRVLIPDPNNMSWVDTLDFVNLQLSGALSIEDDPTAEQLVAGAEVGLDQLRSMAEEHGLQVLTSLVYASVEQSWRGTSFVDIQLANAPWNGEDAWDQSGLYRYSEVDQARVVDAYLRAAATRSWVVGLLPFGYWNHDLPLEPGFSIRGKSAEAVMQQWMRSR